MNPASASQEPLRGWLAITLPGGLIDKAPFKTNAACMQQGKWEYLVVPLDEAGKVKKSADLRPERLNELGSQGWEAVGLTLKRGDLVAWPVVLLKRPVAVDDYDDPSDSEN